jgi:cysteinyl-tRNA synthetase
MKIYNTLTRKVEEFKPIKDKKVGMYTCGPTVYWFAHIGNLRTYIFEDILKRVLRYDGYGVKHVMNITDVGHLTSDSDEGMDKLEKGAAREHKTVWEIAEFYTAAFIKDMHALNIEEPDVWVKATDTIPQQIELIKMLEKKGFTYIIDDGVYFDTVKLGDRYGRLWTDAERKELRSRIEENKQKKNPADFALWKFSPKDEKRQMEWDSPWGIGFPGWHTECVVMGADNLGLPFDIHCGGVDHISIHHTNEIAQAEAAYDTLLANYWMHGEFLALKDAKMSKSAGNITTVAQLKEKGINPLAYRYLCLNNHYRSKMVYSDESLEFAQTSLDKLYKKVGEFKNDTGSKVSDSGVVDGYKAKFLLHINNDLDTSSVLALVWELVKDEKLSNKDKYGLLLDFDKVLGLRLSDVGYKISGQSDEYIIETRDPSGMPLWTDDMSILAKDVIQKLEARKQCRENKEWEKADKIRDELKESGWLVEDSDGKVVIRPVK